MQQLKSFYSSPHLHTRLTASFATSSTASNPKKSKFNIFSRSPPLPNLRPYYDLRIFKHSSWTSLFSSLLVNNLSRRRLFALRCGSTHGTLTRFLGRRVADNVLFGVFGNRYLSGISLDSIRRDLVERNDRDIPVSVSYRIPTNNDSSVSEYELEENAARYIQSIEFTSGSTYKGNAISIDLGALGNLEVLVKVSRAQNWFQNVFESYSGRYYEKLPADAIYDKLKLKYVECEESEFAEFLSQLLHREISSDLSREEITKFEWLEKMHAFYIESPEKNEQKLLRQINRLTDEEVHKMGRFCNRLEKIYEKGKLAGIYAISNEVQNSQLHSLKNSISQQYSTKYNVDGVLVLNTVQSEEGNLRGKIEFEAARCEYFGIPLGIKVVGSGSSVEGGSFDQDIESLLDKHVKGSKVIIASGSEESVENAKKVIEKKGLIGRESGIRISQRKGIGSHVMHKMVREGHQVIEEVYYGKREDSAPWVVKRVEESYGNGIAARIENKLVWNEIKRRLRLA